MPRERTERAHGPYKHGTRWRVVLVAADGKRCLESFETRIAAQRFLDEANRQAEGRSVSQAVAAFLQHLRGRGLRSSTLRTYEHRLTAILQLETAGAVPLWTITPKIAADHYARRVEVTKADTHHLKTIEPAAYTVTCSSPRLPAGPIPLPVTVLALGTSVERGMVVLR